MNLYWRVMLVNASVLAAATGLLLFAPVTVSVPVLPQEAVVLCVGLVVMLAANAVLLRIGLAPLHRLMRLMGSVDLLRPAQRLPVAGGGEVAELIRAFNEMLDRLETERGTSAARALSAQEAERRRVARELHDQIGQTLTAVLLDLKRSADRAPAPLRTDLRRTQEAVRESLDEVRRIARQLRPGVLEDLGLVSALGALATEFSACTQLIIDRHFEPDLPQLVPEAELVLYRVAQESLTNIARHAQARRVELAVIRRAGEVVLNIRDDGRGIDKAQEGSGIRGMRERALLAGGRLTIEPVPGGGTEVCLRVPIHGRDGSGR